MRLIYFVLGLGLLVVQFLMNGGSPVIGIFFHPAAYLASLTVPLFLSHKFGFKNSYLSFVGLKNSSVEFKNDALKVLGLVVMVYSIGGLAIMLGNIAGGPDILGENLAKLMGGLGVGAMGSLWVMSLKCEEIPRNQTVQSNEVGKSEKELKSSLGLLSISLFGILVSTFMALWMIQG